ncbi:MAG: hypothetical protein K8T91_07790 [Planctomycetes bacterium]|nr:hypothetical protein [Planctomycetota bacterium]
MKLPVNERLSLVTRLMDTLLSETPGLSLDEPGLLEELDRRWAENSKGIAWSVLRDRA